MRFPIAILGWMVVLTVLVGCNRETEEGMRARLAQWFQLGETLAFAAEARCAAGAFRLVQTDIGSGIALERSTDAMVRLLVGRTVVAVDDPRQTPDQVMVEAANKARSYGMAMRRAALEARDCMDGRLGVEFQRLLVNRSTVFAYDRDKGAVMLMDRRNRVLVVAVGNES